MSQSREIPETERAKYTRNPPDGTIVDNFGIIDYESEDYEFSDVVDVGGLKWKFGIDKKSLDEKEFVCVSLIPQHFTSPPRNIELTAEFLLIHDTDDKKNVSKMHHYILRDFTEPLDCFLMPWEEMMDDEKGFIGGKRFQVEMRLTILKGLRCNPTFDFASSRDIRSDVALKIEGKSVHVNKQYLGFYSPVFQSMFFGEFAEKGKDEIELKDVEYEYFIELLNVIYPSQKSIGVSYAEHLINLADRFQIPSVINRAEEVLIVSDWSAHTPMEKLRIADQYSLFRLQEHCISALENAEEFRAIKNDPIYEGLSDATKIALFERVVEVMPESTE